MSVSLLRNVRLLVGAGSAKPGPAIGQALGPLGLNMAEFCKQFNEATKNYEKDVPLPISLSAFSNRTFTFTIKTPQTSWLLKKCAGVKLGAGRPGHEIVGKVHVKQLYEIAKIKRKDSHLKHLSLENLCRIISGSAHSMGIEIVGGNNGESPKWASTWEEQASIDKEVEDFINSEKKS